MVESCQNKKKCPRCGHEDSGKYCSQCSYDLNLGREDVLHELYNTFIPKFFDKFPLWGKFIKTWWCSFFTPGRIILADTFATNSKYLSDIEFTSTLFYFALGSALVKSIFSFEDLNDVGSDRLFFDFIVELFKQSYILWIFGFILLAFIWTGRIWKKWMKMESKDRRQHDSNFVYEFGALLTVILILFWIIGFKIGDEITKGLQVMLIILVIFIVLHFLYLLITLGVRAKLPMIRLLLISLASAYIIIFVAFAAEIITLPIMLVPIFLLLSPFYYIGRTIYKKFKNRGRIGT